MSRLPDFIIIGAAKCGTTSLYKKLSQHANVFMSTPKEPEYFARDDIFQKGRDWYAGLFEQAGENQLCGEASTLYSQTTLFPHTVARMHDAVPKVKLIYVVREPVERTYSYYTQLVKNYQNSTRNFVVTRTIEEFIFPDDHPNRADREHFFAPYDTHLPDDPKTLLEGSRYMRHIDNYLAAFDRSQLLLLDFADLIHKPDDVMIEICAFLGLDPGELIRQEQVRENISSEHFAKIDRETVKQSLVSKVKNHPWGKKLYDFTPSFIRKALLNLYASLFRKQDDTARPPKMLKATQSYLENLFEDDMIALEKFWQRDLSVWKKTR